MVEGADNRTERVTLYLRAVSISQSSWVPVPAMVRVVPGWVRRTRGVRRADPGHPSRIRASGKQQFGRGPDVAGQGANGRVSTSIPLWMTWISSGPNSRFTSSRIDSEQVMRASASLASHHSTECTCRLAGAADPTAVPARLGGVDRGHQRHVEELGGE